MNQPANKMNPNQWQAAQSTEGQARGQQGQPGIQKNPQLNPQKQAQQPAQQQALPQNEQQ